jgi:hypothetical protein
LHNAERTPRELNQLNHVKIRKLIKEL